MAKRVFERYFSADIKKVFHCTTNFIDFQKIIPQYFPSIRVLSTRGNVSIVEEHLRIGGKEFVMMVKHNREEPNLHELFVIGGDCKGTHIIVSYQSNNSGTKVIFEIDWKLKGRGKLFSMFSKQHYAEEYVNIFDELTKFLN